jgi:hypothetical protein
MTRSTYTPANGEPRDNWSLLADTVVVAKSARPSGRKAAGNQSSRRETWERDGDAIDF